MKKRIISVMMTVLFLLTLVTPFDVAKANEVNKVSIVGNHLDDNSNLQRIRDSVPSEMPDIAAFGPDECFSIQNKGEELYNGEHINDDFKINLTTGTNNENEKATLNWSVEPDGRYQVYYVFVKGANGGYLYWYNNEETGDNGLHGIELENAEGYHGISHVVIFYKEKQINPPQQVGSVKVIKTKDENGDGDTTDIQLNEGFHQGVKFTLIPQIEGGTPYSSETNSNGEASFINIPVGDYKIYETPTPGYRSSLKDGEDVKVESDITKEIPVVNTRLAYIEVRKFIRENGLQKHADIPIILMQGDTEIGRKNTDIDGVARFDNLKPGKYTVIEGTTGKNYLSTLPTEVEIIGSAPLTVEAINIETEPGTGVLQLTKLKKTLDGQTGYFPGIEFKLYDSAGKQAGESVVTDDKGYALFRNLLPGDYTLREENLPSGYTTNLQNNNIYKVVAGGIVTVQVINTQQGEVPPEKGKITIIKKMDTGIPHEGVEFTLTKYEPVPTLKDQIQGDLVGWTNSNGILEFNNLESGDYILKEIGKEGFSTKINGNDTDTIRITINPSDPLKKDVVVNVKNSIILNEGEEFKPGTISGFKYNDKNGNGRLDEGEEKLAGWRIVLYRVTYSEEKFVGYTTTDPDGYYSFKNVLPGEYYLREEPDENQKNWRMTQPVESNGYHPMVPPIDILRFNDMYVGESRYLSSTTNVDEIMPQKAFVAEGRIGVNGPTDYKFNISQNGAIKAENEYQWPNNGTPVGFSISYDKHLKKITYTLGTNLADPSKIKVIEYPLDDLSYNCSDIILKAQSTKPGTGIILNNLSFNGEKINKFTSAAASEPGLLLIRANRLFNPDGFFTLDGTVSMFWNPTQQPQMNFQIMFGSVLSEANLDMFVFGNVYDSIVNPDLPDLSVTKTDNNATIRPGEKVTYKIKVTYTGKEDITNVNVVETLPLYTSFVSESEYNQGWTIRNQSIIAAHIRKEVQQEQQPEYYYNIEKMKPGQSIEIPFTVRLNDKNNLPSDLAMIRNTVIVEMDGKESTYENNTATDTTPIDYQIIPPSPPPPPPSVVYHPDLTISKTDGNITAKPGDEVEYKITVKNNGDAGAYNVKVSESLPEHTSFVESKNSNWKLENGKYVYEIGTLSVNEAKEIKFVVKVDSSIPESIKKVINNVEVKTTSTEYNNSNNTASDDTPIAVPVVEIVKPILEVIKTDDGATVLNGEPILYKITVTNKGSVKAEEVKLFEKLPEYTAFDEAGNSGWVKSEAGYTFDIGVLEAGESKTVEFKVIVDKSISYSIDKVVNTVVLRAKGINDISASDDTEIIISTPPVLPETGRENNVNIFAGVLAAILLAAGILIRKIK